MLKIIHRNQYGLLKGRSIQDCLAWAFEYIHQCQASGRACCILKLDFAKAFDTIQHEPMIEIKQHMGFNEKWLGWIKCIFSSGSYSVLLNGTPGKQFDCLCGVRQGDPLSPLIFVLAADLLQSAINDATRNGLLQLPLPSSDSNYPVIQYADDTIAVLQATVSQAQVLKSILVDYAKSVGLKINFHKSTLVPISCDPMLAGEIAAIFGCSLGSIPLTYLGLPMGTTRPSLSDLMPMVASVQRKMPAAISLLDYGSKLTLLNSVVTSLVVYAMCSIKINPRIIEHLDKLRRSCLWVRKSDDGIKGSSFAAWDMVCKPKTKGGLGIIDLKTQNQGLLLKQLHKFYNKHDVPWVKLIWDSYYVDKIPHASDPCGSFWWRDLMSMYDIYRGITKAKVFAGDTILFWKDSWNTDTLQDRYPRAFSFARNPDVSVRHLLSSERLGEVFHLPLTVEAKKEVIQIQS